MNAQASALTAEFLTRLRAFVRGRVRSEHDAEDIVQDVLAKLVQHDESIKSASVYAWIFTVARRAIIDHSRDSFSRDRSELTDAVAVSFDDDQSVSSELAKCIEPMLISIDRNDRALLQRVDMLGESQVVVASELGLSVTGLKSRVQRARRRLRALIEDCCTIERDRVGRLADYHRKPDRPCPCDGCG